MAAMPRWRILADDLTGALDTVALLGHATGVPVYLGPHAPSSADGAADDIAALSTGTRDAAAHALDQALAPAAQWLAGAGVPYKKVDSLLRGNTFAELAAVLRGQTRLTRIVFAPAYPAQGRFTADDKHWAGAPHDPSRHGDAQDACAGLVAAFAAVGLHARCAPTLAGCGDAQVMIPRVLGDADLDAVAAAQSDPSASEWLWAGSAGLAAALARLGKTAASDASPYGGAAAPADASPDHAATALGYSMPQRGNAGATLLVTSSRHPTLRAQLSALRTRHPAWFDSLPLPLGEGWDEGTHRAVQPAKVAAGAALTPALSQREREQISSRRESEQTSYQRQREREPASSHRLAQRQPHIVDLSPAQPLDAHTAQAQLTHNARAIAQAFAAPQTLLVVGGDTLLALCEATGATHLIAYPSDHPGWGRARLCGGTWDGAMCLSRSGAFGGPDDLIDLLNRTTLRPTARHPTRTPKEEQP